MHALQCLASWKCQKESQAYSSLGHGKMKAEIASIVSLLTQQPRALQKHPRLLVTMRKRILGQSPAVGTRGAMQITQTSHVQQLKLQICSFRDQFTHGSDGWEREAVVTAGWDEQIHQCIRFLGRVSFAVLVWPARVSL